MAAPLGNGVVTVTDRLRMGKGPVRIDRPPPDDWYRRRAPSVGAPGSPADPDPVGPWTRRLALIDQPRTTKPEEPHHGRQVPEARERQEAGPLPQGEARRQAREEG